MYATQRLPNIASDPSFHPASRVWIYIADRNLNDAEAFAMEQAARQFTRQWTSHNQLLQATAEVYGNRILILLVDESRANAGGCSIDKSVRFLESLGENMQVDLFNRLQFAWLDGERLVVSSRDEFAALLREGRIGPDTPVLNTLVQTRAEMNEKWVLPFFQSWMKKLFK